MIWTYGRSLCWYRRPFPINLTFCQLRPSVDYKTRDRLQKCTSMSKNKRKKGKSRQAPPGILWLILEQFKTVVHAANVAAGAGTLVMSGQENKGKVCTRHENVSSIRSEINFEVNAILADTDLLQIHDIFMEVIFINFLRTARTPKLLLYDLISWT